MEKILTSATLDGYSPRKDGSFTLRFVTNEIGANDVAKIHTALSSFGYLYYKPEETLTKEEIKELDSLETDIYDQPKTKSERLRNTLYVLWKQKGIDGDFKDFYDIKLEEIINHFKSKLEV